MKKTLIAVLAVVLLPFAVFASQSDASIFANPASVYLYNQTTKFAFKTLVSTDPEIDLGMEFINKRITLAIDVDMFEVNQRIQRDVVLDINAAVGYGNFGFGMSFYGGSSMDKNKSGNFIAQSIFGTYERLEESQFIAVKAGAVYKLNQFTFGFTADKILSYSINENKLSFAKAIDYVSTGVSWNQEKYAKRGRLNKWVFNADVEFLNIFNSRERTLSVDAGTTLQLSKDYSFIFSAGTDVQLIENGLRGFSAGIGARFDMFGIDATFNIPLGKPVSIDFKFTLNN